MKIILTDKETDKAIEHYLSIHYDIPKEKVVSILDDENHSLGPVHIEVKA